MYILTKTKIIYTYIGTNNYIIFYIFNIILRVKSRKIKYRVLLRYYLLLKSKN